ncbi:MAG: FAD-binding protein [Micromonosporaceae bacterium]|nr:FAD-binding protein [Micromonosporaceae bacterium]
MTARTRSWWGWGWQESALSDGECRQLAPLLPGLSAEPIAPPDIGDVDLPAPRPRPPSSLAARFSSDPLDRAGHTYGKAYRDVARALRGDFSNAPDLVAFPTGERDVVDILDWATGADVAVVPYGGGSSVVGGVECRDGRDRPGVVSLDLTQLDRVLEFDPVSRAARIQAGALGPRLEAQLRGYEATLRHFPQSFEFSTLGGWLATRAGGHYATLRTHIDDFVESMRVVTPSGVSESWRLPASGAGPSPDRLFLGSEGALGVIVEAWLRVQDRPRFKASAAVRFTSFGDAVEAVREIAQSGLNPVNCRLLDPGEAALSGATTGGESVLVLGFESAAIPVDTLLTQAVELAAGHGGVADESGSSDGEPGSGSEPGSGGDAVAAWRAAFLRMPYLRDGLARVSGIAETFETACAWQTVIPLYEALRAELGAAIEQVCGAPGLVNCRFTHVYPDGAAPYFTVIAPGRPGSEVAMWDELKVAASEVLHRHGATITHHHAVGRDHRPWYDRQRPDPFAAALKAAKEALDPAGILNPGVLID